MDSNTGGSNFCPQILNMLPSLKLIHVTSLAPISDENVTQQCPNLSFVISSLVVREFNIFWQPGNAHNYYKYFDAYFKSKNIDTLEAFKIGVYCLIYSLL